MALRFGDMPRAWLSLRDGGVGDMTSYDCDHGYDFGYDTVTITVTITFTV